MQFSLTYCRCRLHLQSTITFHYTFWLQHCISIITFLPNTTNMQNIFDCIYSVTRNTPIICQVPNEVVGICVCLCVCACVCAHIYVMSMFPLILYNTEFITLFYNSKNLWLTEVTYLEKSGLNNISSPCTPTI